MTIGASRSNQPGSLLQRLFPQVVDPAPGTWTRLLSRVSATSARPTAAASEPSKPRACGLVRLLRRVFCRWFGAGSRTNSTSSVSSVSSTRLLVPSPAQRAKIHDLQCEIEVLLNLQVATYSDEKVSELLGKSILAYKTQIKEIQQGGGSATAVDDLRDDIQGLHAHQLREKVCQTLIELSQTLRADNVTCLEFYLEQFKLRLHTEQPLFDRSLALTGYRPEEEPELDHVIKQYRDRLEQCKLRLATQKIAEDAKQHYQAIKPLLLEQLLPAIDAFLLGKSAHDKQEMATQIAQSFLGGFIEMNFYDKYLLEIKPSIAFAALDLDEFKTNVERLIAGPQVSLLSQALRSCAPAVRAATRPDLVGNDLQTRADQLLDALRDYPKIPLQSIVNAGARRKVLTVLGEVIKDKENKTATKSQYTKLMHHFKAPLNGDRRKIELSKYYLDCFQQLDVTDDHFQETFERNWKQYCDEYNACGLLDAGASLTRLANASLSTYRAALLEEIKDSSHAAVARQRLIPKINRWLQQPKQSVTACEAVIAASPLHHYLQVNTNQRSCVLRPVPLNGKAHANLAALRQAMEQVSYNEYDQNPLAKALCEVVADALIELPVVKPLAGQTAEFPEVRDAFSQDPSSNGQAPFRQVAQVEVQRENPAGVLSAEPLVPPKRLKLPVVTAL